MRRIVQMLRAQAVELASLAVERGRRAAAAVNESAVLLEQLLDGVSPDAPARVGTLLRGARAVVRSLRDRLGLELTDGELAAHQLTLDHVHNIVSRLDPRYDGFRDRFTAGANARLLEQRSLQLHQPALDRYAAQAADLVQRHIIAAAARDREVAPAARQALESTAPKAELMTRTELNRAYNDAHLESARELEAVDPQPGDPVLKRIEEYFDHRNHPFSRVADGQAVPLEEPFRVSVAAVAAAASALGKRSSGVLWPVEGSNYVGMNLPAHFNERGRIVAWRASWGTP